MKRKEKIVLVGGGGHCEVVIDALNRLGIYDIVGIVDKNLHKDSILGVRCIGSDDDLLNIYKANCLNAFISVASIGDVTTRLKLFTLLKKIGYHLPNIIHPSATVASSAKIGEGVFVAAGAIVGPFAYIGNNVIVNTNASVDHDCKIADFAHVAPGAVLSGGVEVDTYSHVGAGAVIIEYKKIGKNTLIGAGSVVVDDIPADIKAYGNPCRVIEKRK